MFWSNFQISCPMSCFLRKYLQSEKKKIQTSKLKVRCKKSQWRSYIHTYARKYAHIEPCIQVQAQEGTFLTESGKGFSLFLIWNGTCLYQFFYLVRSRREKIISCLSETKLAQNFREKWLLPAGKVGRSDSQIGRSKSAKLRHFPSI